MSKLKLRKLRDRGKAEEDKLGTKIDDNKKMSVQNSSEMIQRAIASAQKHDIKLTPGTQNPGGGDCSYLSVIYNINDRGCFCNKFPLSPEYYRRVWTIDLMNKVLDKRIPWNPGLTRQEIQAGFQEIMESGVYERSFFGDMMMVGIACGVRKRILIFNTHTNTTHDPISVVDPRDYGGEIDSEIPVVVAYNLVHFESLHPANEKDIQETVKLVNSYSTGSYEEDYGFTRQDMLCLTTESIVIYNKKYASQGNEKHKIRSPPPKKTKYSETDDDSATKKNNGNTPETEDFIFENILFKETGSGNTRCGVCMVECARLIVHMNGSKYCTEYFSDMAEFRRKYSEFRDRRSRKKNMEKSKAEGQEKYETIEDGSKVSLKTIGKDEKAASFRFGGFDFEELENGKVRCGVCQVECIRLVAHINGSVRCAEKFRMPEFRAEYSRYRHNKRVREHESRKKSSDPKSFKDSHNKREQAYQAKKKAADPKGFKDNHNKIDQKCKAKKKATDPIVFKENNLKRVKEHVARKKQEDPKGFKDNVNKRKAKQEKRQKEKDPVGFKENLNKRVKKIEDRKKKEDPKGFKEHMRQRKEKSNKNVSACKRLQNFRRRVQFGPIFICSCCHQRLFENQVEEITDGIKEQIDKADPEIRKECTDQEEQIDLGRNDAGIEIKKSFLIQFVPQIIPSI